MDKPNIAALAEKLTEAQRDALLNGECGVPRGNEEWTPECLCGAPEDVRRELLNMQLATLRELSPGGLTRSPLGLAVCAHLQEKSNAE